MTTRAQQLDTSAWGSAFGVLEWKDTRYGDQPLASQRILEQWSTHFTDDQDPSPPEVVTVLEGTADAFVRGLASLLSRCARNLQTLLVLCHGDDLGLCQTVDSQEHLSYNGFWEALQAHFEGIASGESDFDLNCDIGGGPGHGLVVIFGACHSMAHICSHSLAPKYLKCVVGFSGTPNLSTVETVFNGYARHEDEGFELAQELFHDAALETRGLDAIPRSIAAVASVADKLEPSAPDPHGFDGDSTPDLDEGLLLEYCPDSGRIRQLPLGKTKHDALVSDRETS